MNRDEIIENYYASSTDYEYACHEDELDIVPINWADYEDTVMSRYQ